MNGEEFLRALDGTRGQARRVRLPLVWRAFFDCAPHLRGHPDARAELSGHLSALAEGGRLRLPRSTRLYDRAQLPPLPEWVELGGEAPSPSARGRAAEIAWHPALAFVSRLPRLAARDLEDLLRVQRFLAEDVDGPVLTARERSLRLFDDEKRLEQIARGPLFRDGRLSYGLLRCRPVTLPFVFRDFGAGDRALVIENKDTFFSACEARLSLPGSSVRWIVFGHGNAIHASIESMLQWPELPRRLHYFGDVDRRGLEIARGLDAIVRALGRLPALECAVELYDRLFASASASRRPLGGGHCRDAEASSVASWLPLHLADRAIPILRAATRLPQEWVTESDFRDYLGS